MTIETYTTKLILNSWIFIVVSGCQKLERGYSSQISKYTELDGKTVFLTVFLFPRTQFRLKLILVQSFKFVFGVMGTLIIFIYDFNICCECPFYSSSHKKVTKAIAKCHLVFPPWNRIFVMHIELDWLVAW